MSDRRTRRRDRRDLRTRDEVYGEMDDLQQDHPAYYQSAGQAIPNAVYSDQVVASPCQSANHVQIIYDAQGQAYYQPCPVCGQYPSQDADDRLARSPNDANQGQVYYQQYPASGQFPSRDVEDRLVAPPNDPDPDQAYYQQYPASEQYQSQDVNDPPVPPPNVESQGHDTYDDAYDRSSVDVQAGRSALHSLPQRSSIRQTDVMNPAAATTAARTPRRRRHRKTITETTPAASVPSRSSSTSGA